jgi:hypothetical protein
MGIISQERMNNKSFMKILNRLAYANILDKVKKEIDENTHFSTSQQKIPSHYSIPLPDEYIANIFGPPPSHDE